MHRVTVQWICIVLLESALPGVRCRRQTIRHAATHREPSTERTRWKLAGISPTFCGQWIVTTRQAIIDGGAEQRARISRRAALKPEEIPSCSVRSGTLSLWLWPEKTTRPVPLFPSSGYVPSALLRFHFGLWRHTGLTGCPAKIRKSILAQW